MRKKLVVLVVTAAMLIVMSGVAAAQTGYGTPFTSSITGLNLGTGTATINYQFYNEGATSPERTETLMVNAGAGNSLFLGNVNLSADFNGAVVISSDQNVVASAVQIPQPSNGPVRNRPLYNGFRSGSPTSLIATTLKNQFNTHTTFAVQNADSKAIDIKVSFYNAANPQAAPIVVEKKNVAVGAPVYFDLGDPSDAAGGALPASFNGSAIVEGFEAGTTTPANVVSSALELQTNNVGVRAFEGVTGGSKTVYMATALCNAFGGQTSFYAVQNTSRTDAANVTVTYSDNSTKQVAISAGAKASINPCDTVSAGFSGAATITSVGADIVVVGKVGGAGRYTAFLGESSGADELALPYVRWSETQFPGSRQRANIAIQNVGSSAVNGVTVEYRDKNGDLVGTHTIGTINAGEKANSNPVSATGDAAKLAEFGTPDANPGGGFGGGAIVKCPGGQCIAVVRIASKNGDAAVAEDYNGVPTQ